MEKIKSRCLKTYNKWSRSSTNLRDKRQRLSYKSSIQRARIWPHKICKNLYFNIPSIHWFTFQTKTEICIRNGKSASKASRKCLPTMKHKHWLSNYPLSKLLRLYISPNHSLKRLCKNLFFHQKTHSETFTMRSRHWSKTLQFHWAMICKCKSWLQYHYFKESILQFYSTRTKFLYRIGFFRMIKTTKKTLCFSEWKTLNKQFWISSR